MAASDNLYSRFIGWSKILLPLAALALLSTLFLFARKTSGELTIPYAEIEEIARDPRISEPAFSGVADDGSVIAVHARTIRPDPDRSDSFFVDDLQMDITATDGAVFTVTSGEGYLNGPEQVIGLSGLSRVTSSSGFALESQGLVADLAAGTLVSVGPIAIMAPFGEMTAGGVEISTLPDQTALVPIDLDPDGLTQSGSRMVFNNGVRLLYQRQP